MKYCSQCGSQNNDDAAFCVKCGYSFAAAEVPQSQPPTYYQQPYADPVRQQGYSTLGGWLLVIVILNAITLIFSFYTTISGIGTVFEIAAYGSPLMTFLVAVEQLINIGIITMTIIFIVKLLTRDSSFLLFEQIGRILGCAVQIYGIIVYVALIGSADEIITSSMSTLIGTAAGFFLFTLYYCRSVRVRTYMGGDEFKRKALFTYK
jgi:hypothetical protein